MYFLHVVRDFFNRVKFLSEKARTSQKTSPLAWFSAWRKSHVWMGPVTTIDEIYFGSLPPDIPFNVWLLELFTNIVISCSENKSLLGVVIKTLQRSHIRDDVEHCELKLWSEKERQIFAVRLHILVSQHFLSSLKRIEWRSTRISRVDSLTK